MRPLLLGLAYCAVVIPLDMTYGIEAGALFSAAFIVGLILWTLARPANEPTV